MTSSPVSSNRSSSSRRHRSSPDRHRDRRHYDDDDHRRDGRRRDPYRNNDKSTAASGSSRIIPSDPKREIKSEPESSTDNSSEDYDSEDDDEVKRKRRKKESKKSSSSSSKRRAEKKLKSKSSKKSKRSKKKKKKSDDSDDNESSGDDIDVDNNNIDDSDPKFLEKLEEQRAVERQRQAERKRRMKSLETPEEKRARRLAKKLAKENKAKAEKGWGEEYMGYSNVDNPWGDNKLTETFMWRKKLEKDGMIEKPREIIEKTIRERVGQNREELERFKQARNERESVREEMELMRRDEEQAQHVEWLKQEDTFHLKQAKERSKIRIRERRAKAIDYLARYVSVVEDDEKKKDEVEDEVDEVEMREPYHYLTGLAVRDLEDLLADIHTIQKLEASEDHAEFWADIGTIAEEELAKLRKSENEEDRQVDRRREGIHGAVNKDISGMLKGKSHQQLALLEVEIKKKIRSGEEGVDIGYWESLLSQLKSHMARARLREGHEEKLREKARKLKQEQGVLKQEPEPEPDDDEPKSTASEFKEPSEIPSTAVVISKAAGVEIVDKLAAGNEDDQPGPSALTSELGATPIVAPTDFADLSKLPWSKLTDEERADRRFELYDDGRYSPSYIREDSLPAATEVCDAEEDMIRLRISRKEYRDKGTTSSQAEDQMMARVREGMGSSNKDEATFAVEENIQQKYLWSDKYKPRKPRYFNRVHTGFEWNKYNQTHYDLDNPPPKIVQGYKFNIFYPDLLDPNEPPEFALFACDDKDFAILRFKAGAPYEDIAFRIVCREWDADHKRGYRCQFQNVLNCETMELTLSKTALKAVTEVPSVGLMLANPSDKVLITIDEEEYDLSRSSHARLYAVSVGMSIRERVGQNREELERFKQARNERESVREEMELMRRDEEQAQHAEWLKQEDTFHLKQAKERSKIRIRERRAKAIDYLARYVSVVEDDEKKKDEVEDEVDEVEMREPYHYLTGLAVRDLEDLLADIHTIQKLEASEDHAEFWADIGTIAEEELAKLRKSENEEDRQVDRRREGIHGAVNKDISGMLKGKSHQQLALLEVEIKKKIRSGEEGVDIGYWESLLSQLKSHMARARLREGHEEKLREKARKLKQEQGVLKQEPEPEPDDDEPKSTTSEFKEPSEIPSTAVVISKAAGVEIVDKLAAGNEDDQPGPSALTSELGATPIVAPTDFADLSKLPWSKLTDEERADRRFELYDDGRYSPSYIREDSVPAATEVCDAEEDMIRLRISRKEYRDKGTTSSQAEDQMMARVREGMGSSNKDEATFAVEENIQQKYLWSDKYKPRKPRYFNRVHTGFEWNKYNQTHYDLDNPPPKIVQGYKFNIFYPDLLDPNEPPEFALFACDDKDFAILRFKAGAPYEDIAFRIVCREWDADHKRGYRCQFQNGIFQLWFQFKRWRYRR